MDPKTGGVTIEQVERQQLTEEEIEERDQLLSEGFGDWKRRDLLVRTPIGDPPSASKSAHTGLSGRLDCSNLDVGWCTLSPKVCICIGRTSWQVVQSTAGAI